MLSQSTRVCSVDGCATGGKLRRGWCNVHYKRWKKYDDPLGGGPEQPRLPHSATAEDRFWSYVDRSGECWLWAGAKISTGYGHLSVDGKMVLSHRFAYELLIGPIAEGMTLDHLCHNASGCIGGNLCPHRRCVRLAHLEPVTLEENKRRGGSFAAVNARKTHCDSGHEYTPENTRVRPDGGRDCRACSRIRVAATYRARKKSRKEAA